MASSQRETHLSISLDSHRSTRFFNPLELTDTLLGMVSKADYAGILQIWAKHPELMFRKVCFQDENYNIFWISPLQRALELYDTTIWKSFMFRIKDHKPYVDLFFEQAREHDRHANLKPIFEHYEHYHRQERRWEEGLIPAHKVPLIRNCLSPFQAEYLPVHMIKEFCREGTSWRHDSSFKTEDIAERSECKVMTDSGEVKSLSYSELQRGFSMKLTLTRGSNSSLARFSKENWRNSEGFFPTGYDYKVLKQLYEVRREERQKIASMEQEYLSLPGQSMR